MEESEEFQEAEILWPDSDSGHGKAQPLQVRRRGRAKKRRKSAETEPTRVEQVSYSWTPGFVYRDVNENVGDGEWKVIPPHVLVARRADEKTAFSVCTGNGRTLKGRDLRQVRDAILRMTGFLER